jgi:hypothetical protein
MVRIVRLALEDGMSFPHDIHEIEWPEGALGKQREKAPKKADNPLEPAPKRRRGRPRKITPQVEWPVGENPSPETPTPQPPAEPPHEPGRRQV